MARSEILRSAARQIRAFQEVEPDYAGPRSPARTDQVSRLLVHYRCAIVKRRFTHATHLTAMCQPAIDGTNIIALNLLAERTDWDMKIRHELSHVDAGENGAFMSDDGWDSPQEQRADLVALADLVSGRFIMASRRAGYAWKAIEVMTREYIRNELALGWPKERVWDRAKLRLRLWRECGI